MKTWRKHRQHGVQYAPGLRRTKGQPVLLRPGVRGGTLLLIPLLVQPAVLQALEAAVEARHGRWALP